MLEKIIHNLKHVKEIKKTLNEKRMKRNPCPDIPMRCSIFVSCCWPADGAGGPAAASPCETPEEDPIATVRCCWTTLYHEY